MFRPKEPKITIEKHDELGKMLREARESIISASCVPPKTHTATRKLKSILKQLDELRSALDDLVVKTYEQPGDKKWNDSLLRVYYGDMSREEWLDER